MGIKYLVLVAVLAVTSSIKLVKKSGILKEVTSPQITEFPIQSCAHNFIFIRK